MKASKETILIVENWWEFSEMSYVLYKWQVDVPDGRV